MKRGVSWELAYRRHVYPRQVACGRMHQPEADRELAAMELLASLVNDVESTTVGSQRLPGFDGSPDALV